MPASPTDARAAATLTVIVPCYNEVATVAQVLDRVLRSSFPTQVIAVDDGSDDGSYAAMEAVQSEWGERLLLLLRHPRNQGKGTAIRTALAHAQGEFTLIQDADLEYDPGDYGALVAPLQAGRASVVYGNRLHPGNTSHSYYRYLLGGKLVTWFTNRLYGLRLHDEPAGFKAFRTDLLQGLGLTCRGFEFCPEVTARLARQGIPIVEVPISYQPRSFAAGKKIRWYDGVEALWLLLRLRLAPLPAVIAVQPAELSEQI